MNDIKSPLVTNDSQFPLVTNDSQFPYSPVDELSSPKEVVWLTREEADEAIREVYCPVEIWTNTCEAVKNRWLSDEEAQLYSEISLTWFRKRSSEQKKLLNTLEEKMRIFQKDAAEKLKQQIMNNSL